MEASTSRRVREGPAACSSSPGPRIAEASSQARPNHRGASEVSRLAVDSAESMLGRVPRSSKRAKVRRSCRTSSSKPAASRPRAAMSVSRPPVQEPGVAGDDRPAAVPVHQEGAAGAPEALREAARGRRSPVQGVLHGLRPGREGDRHGLPGGQGALEPAGAPGVPAPGHAAAGLDAVRKVEAPLGAGVVLPRVRPALHPAVRGRLEGEPDAVPERPGVGLEVRVRLRTGAGLRVEAPVLQIDAQGHAHAAAGGQGLGPAGGRQDPLHPDQRGVLPLDHVHRQGQVHGAPVPGVGHEPPAGGGAGLELGQVVAVQGRNETVGVDPGP